MKQFFSDPKYLKRYFIGLIAAVVIMVGQWMLSELLDPGAAPHDVPPTYGSAHGASEHDIPSVKIPAYRGEPYTVINGGEPFFEEKDMVTQSYEYYGQLDSLGRCTVTMACVGKDIMPKESRGDISSVKPTGWVQKFYDHVDGQALYNRAHLIGFQLTGENANRENLITGTRYFNVEGMLPFENMVADYLREFPKNHVIYRVTPLFEGDDLVARGVLMEAESVEDGGRGVCYCVFVHNIQPGVVIDYATGENREG